MGLTCRRIRGPRRGSSRPLPRPLSRANLSMPVRAMGRTNSGMFASRASAAAVHRTGLAAACASACASRRAFRARNHRGERTLDSRAREARLDGSTRPRHVGADPHAERLDDLCFVRIGQHRHLVAALRTRVDDRERAALGRADGLQLHRAVAGDAEEFHEARFEAVQKSLRHVIQGPANGCFGQFRERDPRSQCRASSGSNGTVPRQGISRPEGSGEIKERLDGVAVAAVVAAHVLDVAEDAIGSLRQRCHRARDHAPRHLGRDRHEQERGCPDVEGPEKISVLDGPLGSRRQIEHQQIERSPLEGPEDLAEERELPRGAPRMGLSVRRALELERLRLRDHRAHREDRDPVPGPRERDLVAAGNEQRPLDTCHARL